RLGDRFGFRRAIQGAIMAAIVSVGALSVLDHPLVLALSSIIIGGLTPGLSPLILGRLQEILPGPRETGPAWQVATILFATGQAAGGYGVSWLFAASGEDYRLLFATGAAALVLAFACSLAGRSR